MCWNEQILPHNEMCFIVHVYDESFFYISIDGDRDV